MRSLLLDIYGALLLFATLWPPIVSRAQVINGKVIDKTTGQGLPYASFGFCKEKGGGIANLNGEFSIELSKGDRKDSLLVSYIGYKGQAVALGNLDLTAPLIVRLAAAPKELPATAVSGVRQLLTVGNGKYNGHFTGWGDYNSSRGRMRGVVIPPKEYPVRLVEFGCHIKHNSFDSVKVRLHLLDFHSDTPSMRELLHDNIYLVIHRNARWVSIDLSRYHIVISDTIVLGIEWVDAWATATTGGERSHLFTFSLSNTPGIVYARDYPYDKPALIQNNETPAMYLRGYRTGNNN